MHLIVLLPLDSELPLPIVPRNPELALLGHNSGGVATTAHILNNELLLNG